MVILMIFQLLLINNVIFVEKVVIISMNINIIYFMFVNHVLNKIKKFNVLKLKIKF